MSSNQCIAGPAQTQPPKAHYNELSTFLPVAPSHAAADPFFDWPRRCSRGACGAVGHCFVASLSSTPSRRRRGFGTRGCSGWQRQAVGDAWALRSQKKKGHEKATGNRSAPQPNSRAGSENSTPCITVWGRDVMPGFGDADGTAKGPTAHSCAMGTQWGPKGGHTRTLGVLLGESGCEQRARKGQPMGTHITGAAIGTHRGCTKAVLVTALRPGLRSVPGCLGLSLCFGLCCTPASLLSARC